MLRGVYRHAEEGSDCISCLSSVILVSPAVLQTVIASVWQLSAMNMDVILVNAVTNVYMFIHH
jgi:hypothetical protein